MNLKVPLLSLIALLAFAGNSVLCRLALAEGSIDPAAFTFVRIISGAIVLMILVLIARGAAAEPESQAIQIKHEWLAPLMLFAYAALFSFAYLSLDTGVGALILFGSVQISLLLMALFRGERFSMVEIGGLLLACSGLVYLVFPELSKPSLMGFVMMSLSGVAWAAYTLKGQGSTQALIDTNSNFAKAVPLVLLLLFVFRDALVITPFGVIMAIASGAVTSGIGYAVWYAVLPNLSTSQAGVMQLLVPIIAAAGGVVFAGELLSDRLIVASALTLGGILAVILVKKKRNKNQF